MSVSFKILDLNDPLIEERFKDDFFIDVLNYIEQKIIEGISDPSNELSRLDMVEIIYRLIPGVLLDLMHKSIRRDNTDFSFRIKIVETVLENISKRTLLGWKALELNDVDEVVIN